MWPRHYTFQEIGHVFHLRDVVRAISTILYQQWEHMVVFATCVRFVQIRQFVEHNAPCFDLLFGVFDMWQFLAMFIVECNIGEIFSERKERDREI